ncbi:dihydropteroate synthase [Egicoccus halophilus]|uniref:dihydropteroate synthase n=1 Tax=Egicoccus halophilus TaxID=1670830 RepID=A0A8J3AAT3_9ACTN|nr:dihydropteroate synthase [Egicoccus halophilus]GGI08873.1 dihydropteroate synthase [Egicoccus halophilus]
MNPRLMGIVNLNPDSFSTAGEEVDDATARALRLVDTGAEVIDLGAQSASPSTPVVPAEDELAVLTPVVTELAARGVTVSVDTYKPAVAAGVVAAGARLVNDYSGSDDAEMLEVVAGTDAQFVLTHNIGPVKQRLTDPNLYDDVVLEVGDWFARQLERLAAHGVAPERVVLDPGIDLSKTPAQTVAVLAGLPDLRARFSNPLLVAISRKDFIGTIARAVPHERGPGTLAALVPLVRIDDTIARVHDVAAARQFLDVLGVLEGRATLDRDAVLDPALYRSDGRSGGTGAAAAAGS